jgi:hypothetical protein
MATPFDELLEVLGELTMLLKNPDVTAALSERRVNASLALVAADGLRAYVEGNRARAMEDFSCVAEEIAARASFGETPS